MFVFLMTVKLLPVARDNCAYGKRISDTDDKFKLVQTGLAVIGYAYL